MEIKLEDLLDVNLSPYAPALDPFVYDLQGKILSQNILQHAIDEIKYRLANAGFNKFDMKLISPYPIDLCIPDDVDYHIDKYCGDVIYLLTFSANGNKLISPPYEPGTHSLMSWRKWIEKMLTGERLPLMNFTPWAQAKFINLTVETEERLHDLATDESRRRQMQANLDTIMELLSKRQDVE